MNTEPLDEQFKDPAHPLRLVFVCAMWMTGFDAPSVSTIYLDRPMRNHTLMQTIARANRVFPDKENGLIVDYVGVFRHLERALAIYARADAAGADSPIQSKDDLIRALATAVAEVAELCERYDIDLDELRLARGFTFIALRDAAVEALLVDEEVRSEFLARARRARSLFKAVLPDPAAAVHQPLVAVIRVLAERIGEVTRSPGADITALSDAVDALLDRSVGAEEYVIRAAAEGVEPDATIDLSQIDFEGLAARFAGRKRAETERLASLLRQRATDAARRNPTRFELVERIEELIAAYNAGSVNSDEYLRRLVSLSHSLSDEERRAVTEGMGEEALAIFDLLTQPEPALDDAERTVVRASARHLLEHLHEKLVLDWRRKAAAMADVRATISAVLDQELPADPYPPTLFDAKVQAIFDHVVSAYGDDGSSVYDETARPAAGLPAGAGVAVLDRSDIRTITAEAVRAVRAHDEMAARVARQLGIRDGPALLGVAAIIENDEDFAVEFKSTARWDMREGCRSKAIEDAVVKTVAGFLNTNGGTLLIGVGPDRQVVGLGLDYPHVKPPNADGFVNWLTTHLTNALGHAAVMRSRARVVNHGGHEVCRLDVGESSRPVWARTSKAERVFFVRMNNSSRALPDPEIDAYVADHWSAGVLTE